MREMRETYKMWRAGCTPGQVWEPLINILGERSYPFKDYHIITKNKSLCAWDCQERHLYMLSLHLVVVGFQFPEWSTAETPSEPPVTHVVDKDNTWLYSLDPILLTIIVMSSLGVLLGAVCAGLLLYCTCSYGGLTSRSSTTLENYNFELYDGIKHKVKLNQQRCCSEAWVEQMGRYQVS